MPIDNINNTLTYDTVEDLFNGVTTPKQNLLKDKKQKGSFSCNSLKTTQQSSESLLKTIEQPNTDFCKDFWLLNDEEKLPCQQQNTEIKTDKKNNQSSLLQECIAQQSKINQKGFVQNIQDDSYANFLHFTTQMGVINANLLSAPFKKAKNKCQNKYIKHSRKRVYSKKPNYFIFPDNNSKYHRVINNYSQNGIKNTTDILGNELSTGFLYAKEFNKLVEQTKNIIKQHYCGDFLPSTLIFVNSNFLKTKDKAKVENINYAVAAFKGKTKCYSSDKDAYIFTTLNNLDLSDKEKILVVTSPLLNEKGDLRDANIGYSYIVQFYDQIEKCKMHSYCNCYNVHTCKNKNLISYLQSNRGSLGIYEIRNYKSQSNYAKQMKNLSTNRIIQAIEEIKEIVNSGENIKKNLKQITT